MQLGQHCKILHDVHSKLEYLSGTLYIINCNECWRAI